MDTENTMSEHDPEENELNQPASRSKTASGSVLYTSITQNRRLLSILTLQIIIILMLYTTITVYSWLHDIPGGFALIGYETMQQYGEKVAAFDFIGVSSENQEPSSYSVSLEVFIWAFMGVMARQLYYLTTIAVRNRKFEVLN